MDLIHLPPHSYQNSPCQFFFYASFTNKIISHCVTKKTFTNYLKSHKKDINLIHLWKASSLVTTRMIPSASNTCRNSTRYLKRLKPQGSVPFEATITCSHLGLHQEREKNSSKTDLYSLFLSGSQNCRLLSRANRSRSILSGQTSRGSVSDDEITHLSVSFSTGPLVSSTEAGPLVGVEDFSHCASGT